MTQPLCLVCKNPFSIEEWDYDVKFVQFYHLNALACTYYLKPEDSHMIPKDMQKVCLICTGIYYGDDLLNHSCSNCHSCSKPFENSPGVKIKNIKKRYNELDRFKSFHNICVNCGSRQVGKPPKEKKGNLSKWF